MLPGRWQAFTIESNALRVAYQPILNHAGEKVLGVEALCRWTHAQRGEISPCEFIPVAEHSGLIVELGECDLLLTNDTGAMHLAALLRLPVVAIFGSTEPRKTMPLGHGHRILRHHVECSPCFLRKCPLDFRCMRAVTSREVIDAVRQVLK